VFFKVIIQFVPQLRVELLREEVLEGLVLHWILHIGQSVVGDELRGLRELSPSAVEESFEFRQFSIAVPVVVLPIRVDRVHCEMKLEIEIEFLVLHRFRE